MANKAERREPRPGRIKALRQYGAIATKTRAMYARRLRGQDWDSLSSMNSVGAVLAYLRGHGGWSRGAAAVPSGWTDRRDVESALRVQLWDEYARLMKFASGDDRRILLLLVYREEYSVILGAARRLLTAHGLPPDERLPDFIGPGERARLAAERDAASWDALVAAAAGGIYGQTLETLSRGGEPDYSELSILLENRCYSSIYAYLTHVYTGLGRRKLRELVGTRADVLNITHILRLRRFPESAAGAEGMLIPVSWRLKRDFARQLMAAPDDGAVLALLKNSDWAQWFGEGCLQRLEKSANDCMESFCRSVMRSALPTICVPQAYLELKELEYDRLVRLIEAVHYGVDPRVVL